MHALTIYSINCLVITYLVKEMTKKTVATKATIPALTIEAERKEVNVSEI